MLYARKRWHLHVFFFQHRRDRIWCVVILSWAPGWYLPIYLSTVGVHPNPHYVIKYLDTYPSFNCSGQCLRISVCRCVVSVLVGLFRVIFDVASVWNLRVGEYGPQDAEMLTLQIAVWVMVDRRMEKSQGNRETRTLERQFNVQYFLSKSNQCEAQISHPCLRSSVGAVWKLQPSKYLLRDIQHPWCHQRLHQWVQRRCCIISPLL